MYEKVKFEITAKNWAIHHHQRDYLVLCAQTLDVMLILSDIHQISIHTRKFNLHSRSHLECCVHNLKITKFNFCLFIFSSLFICLGWIQSESQTNECVWIWKFDAFSNVGRQLKCKLLNKIGKCDRANFPGLRNVEKIRIVWIFGVNHSDFKAIHRKNALTSISGESKCDEKHLLLDLKLASLLNSQLLLWSMISSKSSLFFAYFTESSE